MELSIIVPVYNVEKYLRRCITSLVYKSLYNIEIILINDGSTDKSGMLCEAFEKEYEKVKVFHKINGGLSSARNYGLEKSRGKYILFVDSDDYIEGCYVDILIGKIEEKKGEIITGAAWIEGRRIGSLNNYETNMIVFSGKEYLKRQLKSGKYPVAAWINIYSREFLVKNHLFFLDAVYHEDEEWTPRVFFIANRVLGTNIKFYHYVLRENSITSSEANYKKRAFDRIEICNLSITWILRVKDFDLKIELLDYFLDKYMETIALYIRTKNINKKDAIYRIAAKKKTLLMNTLDINFCLFFLFWKVYKKTKRHFKLLSFS